MVRPHGSVAEARIADVSQSDQVPEKFCPRITRRRLPQVAGDDGSAQVMEGLWRGNLRDRMARILARRQSVEVVINYLLWT
jgi:hypothetical protein